MEKSLAHFHNILERERERFFVVAHTDTALVLQIAYNVTY